MADNLGREENYMAKMPRYLKNTKWSNKPTEFDPVGCDGLYIEKIKIEWWAYPFLKLKVLWKKYKRGKD